MECGTRLVPDEGLAGTAAADPTSSATATPIPAAPAPEIVPPSPPSPALPREFRRFDQVRVGPNELPPTDPEWRMSPIGPLPEQPRRRWLPWVIGAVGACVLLCVVLTVWANTIGRGTLDAIATQAAGEQTRQAEGQ